MSAEQADQSGRLQSMECGSCGQTFNVEDFFDHDCPGSSGRSLSSTTTSPVNGCCHDDHEEN